MNKTETAVSIFNKFAQLYSDKFMDVSLYGESLDIFCNALKKENGQVLELACGPGNVTKYLLNKRSDLKILGTDLAPNMIELARINNPGAIFQLMDCRVIKSLNRKFDGVVAAFCLPYLSKEEVIQLIADCKDVLNPNGVLYLSTMEDDYGKSGWESGSTGDQMYMHYHQADYLTAALEENGFKIIDLQRKSYPGKEEKMVVDLMICGVLSGE